MPIERVDSLDDPRLEPYRDLPRSRVARRSGRFIAEGLFVVERLLASRFEAESIVVSEERLEALCDRLPISATDVFAIPQAVVRRLIGFEIHSGILACGIRQPLATIEQIGESLRETGLVVVCPHTTDPENLGNIIRLCTAFGTTALVLGPQCTDPFSRRAVRVSMGNVFRLPIVESENLATDLERMRDRHRVKLAAMVLDESATPIESLRAAPSPLAILLGHEGRGLSPEWINLCDHHWTIPMSQGTDSLNVATTAAITLYHLTRIVSQE